MSRRLRNNGPSREGREESAARSAPRYAPVSLNGGEVPSAWLSRLLDTTCQLPIEDGPEAVVTALVHAVHALLPDHAFAVSLPALAHEDGGRRVVRTPPEVSQMTLTATGGRVLSEYPHVRVLELGGEHDDVTMYIAATDPTLLVDGDVVDRFVRQVGDVLANALRTTRLVSAKGRESSELRGQIIQSEKLASLGQIAAGVVHELNNPLTSIVGYSEYLHRKAERERRDPSDIERLRRIGEAAGRILNFSRDLMAYARPSIERPAPVPMHAVVDQAFVFCEHVLRVSNVRVVRKFAADVRPVLGVRDQLTQVFVNLFTNACHAMEPNGGTLTVETELDVVRRAVRVVIADTGHGIDPDDMKRIFEPFFSTKTEGRGTGLGLSIVRNIVMLHGGTVAVGNGMPTGTRFELLLPIAQ